MADISTQKEIVRAADWKLGWGAEKMSQWLRLHPLLEATHSKYGPLYIKETHSNYGPLYIKEGGVLLEADYVVPACNSALRRQRQDNQRVVPSSRLAWSTLSSWPALAM